MYVKQAEIKNIRSIQNFEMQFENSAGWHVLIGDNGAGKSTIIRSIALALVGPEEALGLRADWHDWLSQQADAGKITLEVEAHQEDKHIGRRAKLKNQFIPNEINFKRGNNGISISGNTRQSSKNVNPDNYNWGGGDGWFSVAYGPFRRFAGGNQEWTKVFYSLPKLGAHLSAFGEDVALTETTDWLIKLQFKSLEAHQSDSTLDDVVQLINSEDFLPHQARIESISSDGVVFRDGNGAIIQVNQLSDGYRSILSLTFELIRQLVRVYGSDKVFKRVRIGEMVIDLPGVVLIDEIDAHLHPTWQTRIGNWFLKYFPKLQFIVTTHSPLVCRASEKGSIWRLVAPGSEAESGEVTGVERERLIFGNVLDAYGTEVFGKNVSISRKSDEMGKRLAELNVKSIMGQLNKTEENELLNLKTVLPTAK